MQVLICVLLKRVNSILWFRSQHQNKHSLVSASLLNAATLRSPGTLTQFSSHNISSYAVSHQGEFYMKRDGFVEDLNMHTVIFLTVIKFMEIPGDRCKFTKYIKFRGFPFRVCLLRYIDVSSGIEYVGAYLSGNVQSDSSTVKKVFSFKIKFLAEKDISSISYTQFYEYDWNSIRRTSGHSFQSIVRTSDLLNPKYGFLKSDYMKIECTIWAEMDHY